MIEIFAGIIISIVPAIVALRLIYLTAFFQERMIVRPRPKWFSKPPIEKNIITARELQSGPAHPARAESRRTSFILNVIKSTTRAQKQVALLSLELFLVPPAFMFSILVSINLDGVTEVLTSIAPLVGLTMVVAASLAIILGIHSIRLAHYDMKAIGRTMLFSALTAVASFALSEFSRMSLPISTFAIFGITTFLFSTASRLLMLNLLVALFRRETPRRRTLIYGAGTAGMQLAAALRDHEMIEPVAFVDDNSALHGLTITGLPVLKPSKIRQIAITSSIEAVILAMPSMSMKQRTELSRRLEDIGLEVSSLPSFAQLIGAEGVVSKLAPVGVTELARSEAPESMSSLASEHFTSKAVIVTGAGGSVGSEISSQVLSLRPSKLVLLDINEHALEAVRQQLAPLASQFETEMVSILGSVSRSWLIDEVLSKHPADVVIHTASYNRLMLVEENILSGIQNNLFGTLTVSRACERYGVNSFLNISSDKAIRPTSVIGAVDRLSELVLQDLSLRSKNTKFASIRIGNVLGSPRSIITLFREQVARGGPVTLTDPDATGFFITIEEAARRILQVGSLAKGGDVFVVDMGAPVSINGLARQVIEASGYSVRDSENPEGDIEIVITGLRPGEKLHEEPLVSEGHIITSKEKIYAVPSEVVTEFELAHLLKEIGIAIENRDETSAYNLVFKLFPLDGGAPTKKVDVG